MTLLASLRTKATITQNYDKHAETALMNVNICQREGKVRMEDLKGSRRRHSRMLRNASSAAQQALCALADAAKFSLSINPLLTVNLDQLDQGGGFTSMVLSPKFPDTE